MLTRSGAVAGLGPDAEVAWHYGDPTREQLDLEGGAAVVDLSNRGVVTVSGPDRLSWLDTLTTQRLKDLTPGQSREALILSPHGHVENALHLFDDGETTWITVEPEAAAALIAHLERMRFLLRVEIADRTDSFAVVGLVPGGSAEQALLAAAGSGGLRWDDPWPDVVEGGFSYGPEEHPATQHRWSEVLVPRTELDRLLADLPVAGSWASESLRVSRFRPRYGVDTDHRTIPHELDWLRTSVHLNKGCYRGQETVARVKNLGRPPRRLVLLHLDGSEHLLPEPGAEVYLADAGAARTSRAIGRVTTAVRHHELGPVALAVVKRSTSAEAPLEVVVDGVAGGRLAASQELIVQG